MSTRNKLLRLRSDQGTVAVFAFGGDLRSACTLLELMRREARALRLVPASGAIAKAPARLLTDPIPRNLPSFDEYQR
jgi:hypothetical protein